MNGKTTDKRGVEQNKTLDKYGIEQNKTANKSDVKENTRLCEHSAAHEKSLQRAKEKVLSHQDVEKICKIFYLLSDPGRFKIVQTLLTGELCVYHLCEVCQSNVSAVSHQLRLLKDNHIVKARRFGKNVEYSIADMHVREIIEMGIRHLSCDDK